MIRRARRARAAAGRRAAGRRCAAPGRARQVDLVGGAEGRRRARAGIRPPSAPCSAASSSTRTRARREGGAATEAASQAAPPRRLAASVPHNVAHRWRSQLGPSSPGSARLPSLPSVSQRGGGSSSMRARRRDAASRAALAQPGRPPCTQRSDAGELPLSGEAGHDDLWLDALQQRRRRTRSPCRRRRQRRRRPAAAAPRRARAAHGGAVRGRWAPSRRPGRSRAWHRHIRVRCVRGRAAARLASLVWPRRSGDARSTGDDTAARIRASGPTRSIAARPTW